MFLLFFVKILASYLYVNLIKIGLIFMSKSKIYVGNLPFSTSEADLNDLFCQYGQIVECKLISDRYTGRSKGFAFITFGSDQEANGSLVANGTDMDGRQIRVNIAEDRPPRPRGGNGGDRY
jgi:cold-inducible RNA-binding protein